jgi:type II secretory pathway component GspD/PulD (secretin)
MKTKLLCTVTATTLLLTACGTAKIDQSKKDTKITAAKAVNEAFKDQTNIRVIERAVPRGRSVEDVDDRQAVSLTVENGNFLDIVKKIATKMDYGVAVLNGVDATRTVSVDIKRATPEQAIRQVIWAAGYAPVFGHSERSLTIAQNATTVFRIPTDAIKNIKTNFSFGGSPISQSGGGGGGGGGGAGGGGGGGGGGSVSSIKNDFTVTGAYSTSLEAFKRFLESTAGANASVEIYEDGGLIVARGNGQAIKRIHDVLSKYAYDSRRQIEINARLIDVSLSNEFKAGIQWDRVFSQSKKLTAGFNSLQGVVGITPSSVLSYGGGTDLSAVVAALETFTTIEVVSTPRLIVSNNSAGVFFKGASKPYLPSITTTTNATTGEKSQSGQGALAQDGVNLAVYASILDDKTAIVTLQPSVVTLGNLQKFLGDQIQIYEQNIQSSGQRITVRDGETLVVSGSRSNTNNSSKTAIPGVVEIPGIGSIFSGQSKDVNSKESVLVINVRIIRPNAVDIVYAESI